MDHVGRRVAELQLALASRDDIAAFAPETDCNRRCPQPGRRLSYSVPGVHSVTWYVADRRLAENDRQPGSTRFCPIEIRFPRDCANCFLKPSTQ